MATPHTWQRPVHIHSEHSALSKTGLHVLHVDTNAYYGSDEASLTLEELAAWADERRESGEGSSRYTVAQRRKFRHVSRTPALPPQARQFAVSLSPSVVPSNGPLIDSLIASGVSRYGGFKLLERVAVYAHPSRAKVVPGNKEDVFKSKEMSLVEKRRLMKFLLFAAGELDASAEVKGKEEIPFRAFLKDVFQLDGEIAEAVVYALAYCSSVDGAFLLI